MKNESVRYEPPYTVEADELGFGWDNYGSTDELVEATRLASRLTKSWVIRGNEKRVRILDREGKEL
jgi:hypothetical protein